MHILLTNDDGIYAEGIYAAYKELSKIADVTVVAPESEQSSVGHGITLFYPLFAKKISLKNRFDGHAISGKPADCVKFAVSVLLKGKKPDLVISGINFGGNDGCSVFYSGTVAAAREGACGSSPPRRHTSAGSTSRYSTNVPAPPRWQVPGRRSRSTEPAGHPSSSSAVRGASKGAALKSTLGPAPAPRPGLYAKTRRLDESPA